MLLGEVHSKILSILVFPKSPRFFDFPKSVIDKNNDTVASLPGVKRLGVGGIGIKCFTVQNNLKTNLHNWQCCI